MNKAIGKITINVLIVWLILFPSSAFASMYTPLNFSQVAIPNQSTSAQNIAIKNALKNVLVKMSGSEQVLNAPELSGLLAQSKAYVEATRFIAGAELQLEVEFNEAKLQTWLKRNALPLMSDIRPDTLVWMIVDEPFGSERLLVRDTDSSAYHTMLLNAFDNRGLEFTLPLYDLTDLSQVREIDVWGQFVDVIFESSRRYSPDYVIAVKLYVNQESNWQLDSFVKNENTLNLFSYSESNENIAIQKFIHDYAELLAGEYAIDTSLFANNAQIKALLTIDNVYSLTDLAEITKYLQGFNVIEDISLKTQQADKTTFVVSLLAEPEKLVKLIQHNTQKLSYISTPDTLSSDTGQGLLNLATQSEVESVTLPHLYFNRIP